MYNLSFDEIINKVLSKRGNAFFYTPSKYADSKSYLFTDPVEEIEIKASDYNSQLGRIDKLSDEYYSFGYLNYEFGYLLEDKLKSLIDNQSEIGRFFIFNKNDVIVEDSQNIEMQFEDDYSFEISDFRLITKKADYIESVDTIKRFIAAGDTYQVNYTTKGTFDFNGSLAALAKSLIFNQSASFIALINCYPKIIISLSPELFFFSDGQNIIAKPMKGTISRGINTFEDDQKAQILLNSVKDKAENIMIVDLLRNDIGRIAVLDSVKVESKYELEKYESIFQLTSTVKGKLEKTGLKDIITNLFPCGSITGAPKIRTMQIIKEIENFERGIYTGTIGMVLGKNKIFNVAIRTVELDTERKSGTIGLGSGIVWDSDAEKEYAEVKLKAGFLLKPNKYFELIETMLYEDGNYFLLDYHMKRLTESSDFFLFNFDKEVLMEKLYKYSGNLNKNLKYRVRLTLNKLGKVKITSQVIEDIPKPVKIKVSENRINSKNRFQYFKTTNRELYNRESDMFSELGFFDVIFMNESDHIAEGAISNIFIEKDGLLITPPIDSGILNGCFRQYMIDTTPGLLEKRISLNDVLNADRVYVGNSVRKLLQVNEIIL